MYYTRTVYYRPQFPVSYPTISGPTDGERLDYVIQLVSYPARNTIGLRADQGEPVLWRGVSDFTQRATFLRDSFLQRYERFISVLSNEGRLTASEADKLAEPRLILDVVDGRRDRSEPLPTISPTR
jgi:hypothetical protein